MTGSLSSHLSFVHVIVPLVQAIQLALLSFVISAFVELDGYCDERAAGAKDLFVSALAGFVGTATIGLLVFFMADKAITRHHSEDSDASLFVATDEGPYYAYRHFANAVLLFVFNQGVGLYILLDSVFGSAKESGTFTFGILLIAVFTIFIVVLVYMYKASISAF